MLSQNTNQKNSEVASRTFTSPLPLALSTRLGRPLPLTEHHVLSYFRHVPSADPDRSKCASLRLDRPPACLPTLQV